MLTEGTAAGAGAMKPGIILFFSSPAYNELAGGWTQKYLQPDFLGLCRMVDTPEQLRYVIDKGDFSFAMLVTDVGRAEQSRSLLDEIKKRYPGCKIIILENEQVPHDGDAWLQLVRRSR